MPTLDGASADVAIVLAQDNDKNSGLSLQLVDLKSAGVDRQKLASIDPARGQARLTFSDAVAEPIGANATPMSVIEDAFNCAAVVLAFEQVHQLMNNDVLQAFGGLLGEFEV